MPGWGRWGLAQDSASRVATIRDARTVKRGDPDSTAMKTVLDGLSGNHCTYWNPAREGYFAWHRETGIEETEVSILKFILKTVTSDNGLRIERIAKGVGIHLERAKYHLANLETHRYLRSVPVRYGGPLVYSLAHKGREYLVKIEAM